MHNSSKRRKQENRKKNIRNFRGKPIISWSIDAAIKSNKFDSIVSTDDYTIASKARELGAEIPFMRPKEIADDYTDTRTVVNHMIEELNKMNRKYDFICCLYA